ncbi:MAG: DUF4442 domain-containing protein [Gammaproteobacteria bacterium CG_4_10_14_0_8_um_filter_38_16]|nr:MAG: DUF4442 domain-containing protein [Gammaproteobacteria bacterium CG_4_10_14_0_8_um_filter_38_16]PJA03722.1 MAG: DUF4442 domain-containing protein [Gammaproteobacteria bacterium CG_4_10_14_0_2_um_filter_38_22]PJB09915.1 MAG: DUF4442 domain-containing protein [Gammaproteobacteria bacterium CG_4_9_14_3_um_filter_38_9]
MRQLSQLIQKSETSRKYLWLLNRVMNHSVKFNKPHGFQVIKVSSHQVQTFAPYHKKNFNHVRGIHACAIATVGELAAGIILMYHFSPLDYRVIMSHIAIDYHYQAKKNIIATAHFSDQDKNAVLALLNKEHKTTHTVKTEIRDDDHQLIATVLTTWQIKAWEAVKTRM